MTQEEIQVVRSVKEQLKTFVDYSRVTVNIPKHEEIQKRWEILYDMNRELLWKHFCTSIRHLCNDQLQNPHTAFPVRICMLGEDFDDYMAYNFLTNGFPDYKISSTLPPEDAFDIHLLSVRLRNPRRRIFIMLLNETPIGYLDADILPIDPRRYNGKEIAMGCAASISCLRRINARDTGTEFLGVTSKHMMNAAIDYFRDNEVRIVDLMPMNDAPQSITLCRKYGFRYLTLSDTEAIVIIAATESGIDGSGQISDYEISNDEMKQALSHRMKGVKEAIMTLYPISDFVYDTSAKPEDVDPKTLKTSRRLCGSCVNYFQDPVWSLF